jgi:DNA ligase-1
MIAAAARMRADDNLKVGRAYPTGHDGGVLRAEPLLCDVVRAADAVAATTKRTEKVAVLAELFRSIVSSLSEALGGASSDVDRLTTEVDQRAADVRVVVGLLTGWVRQGRFGVGWAMLRDIEVEPAPEPSVTVAELDAVFEATAEQGGGGSQAARRSLLVGLFERLTDVEASFVRRALLGDVRLGALDAVVTDAVAKAAGLPLDRLRRAAMLSGDLGLAASVALLDGVEALAAIGLEPLRAVQPMLAATSPDVSTAIGELGPCSVEWKLDGARIQVHRLGREVRVFTRNLNDVTARLGEVVEVALGFGATSFVLDGEVIGLADDGRPDRFQETMSRFGTDGSVQGPVARLRPFFFDVLHLDGEDLIDRPLGERLDRLDALARAWRVPALTTNDPVAAEAFAADALARGHEGVMVKGVESRYEAGRRGSAWRKVKPVRTLDLVVLAVERGNGRRRGWLSNLHLGARGPDGSFVMVGKTFKGLTDATLAWQTEALRAIEVDDDGYTVWVRPELVVEIALDGVQASSRYPGGVALRFARVRQYRPDKDPGDADTIEAVRAMLVGSRLGT